MDSGRASTLQGSLGGASVRTTLVDRKRGNEYFESKMIFIKRIRAGSTIVVEVVHPAVRIDHSSSQHPVWNQFSQKCGIDHKSVYLNFLVLT